MSTTADKPADSLVSSHVYEIVRTIYSTPGQDGTDVNARVAVLQQTLSQLRLTNIATLDACMNHFTRMIELTSADEEYIASLANSLAPSILRPRVETSLTMEEKHAYRLLRDLFANKTAIFSELKRMSSVGHSPSVTKDVRPRAISTDESHRKANMEERNRLLLEKAGGSRGRATSPAPGTRNSVAGHRRDRSVGRPDSRFPVVSSPTEATRNERVRKSMGPILGVKRSSLEVPGEGPPPSHSSSDSMSNGSESITDSPTSSKGRPDSVAEKRNSLGRNPARFSGGRRIPVNPTVVEDEPRGVTLEDKPMDD